MKYFRDCCFFGLTLALASTGADRAMAADETAARFRLLTLDPGHFHAALVQKFMYADVDPLVHVYAPVGDDVAEHLKRIDRFNARPDQPTRWREQVYTGPDFLQKMLAEKAGNVVVISGNNARKTDYILQSVEAGLNVLADKPMVINPPDFVRLQQAFGLAEARRVLLYDMMTERFEITSVLQRELSRQPALFGELEKGSLEQPAVVMESVHYFSKQVAGVPLKRPGWFFDARQEGAAIVDVATHLVDLVQWKTFPEQSLRPADVSVLQARRWTTPITRQQFKGVTGADDFPDFLRDDVREGVLQAQANGEFSYTLRGVHARVSVKWNFEGGLDTHHSVLRGTKATLEIRQGAEEKFKPTLYVETSRGGGERSIEASLTAAIATLQANYPGVGFRREGKAWVVTVPEKYHVGHEAHFAQVMENFLGYLRAGRLPAWEVPNMLTKYFTLMEAYKLSQPR
jgi:predicted dehydrogenase